MTFSQARLATKRQVAAIQFTLQLVSQMSSLEHAVAPLTFTTAGRDRAGFTDNAAENPTMRCAQLDFEQIGIEDRRRAKCCELCTRNWRQIPHGYDSFRRARYVTKSVPELFQAPYSAITYVKVPARNVMPKFSRQSKDKRRSYEYSHHIERFYGLDRSLPTVEVPHFSPTISSKQLAVAVL